MQMTLCFLRRASGHRRDLLESSTKYLEGKLKLTVNQREKPYWSACLQSEILSILALHWEGTEAGIYVRVHPKSWKKFKSKLKELIFP